VTLALGKADVPLIVGTPAPWFRAPCLDGNPDFAFHSAAGRPVLMLFMGKATHSPVTQALDRILSANALYDDFNCCFFGVTSDPQDFQSGVIASRIPGIRYLLDQDFAASTAYGAYDSETGNYTCSLFVLDRRLRVFGAFALHQVDQAIAALKQAMSESQPADFAPVLQIPRILEPELCRALIELYREKGGEDSGFMREIDGKTVTVTDHSHKRRSDLVIEDEALRMQLQARIYHRLRPAVQQAFQFNATRMERYIVACYDGEGGGYFRPHRDNTTKGTAHRRFAVTINLNAEDYEGGELRFPEYGLRSYRAPTGGAVVFSCSLLHEATPVTKGMRYAFLPFLYDDAAAEIREANNAFLGHGVGPYVKS
jgi:predicted 2-oxoglutarate/Fe(II)-dependent dioxygenase YbiX/peroxiredoxin